MALAAKKATTRFQEVCLLATLGALSQGCDLAGGLMDVGGALTNPDAALLDTPGRKLASGAYHRLLIDGSLDDGGHVIALRAEDGKSEAAIIPYLDGEGCTVSPAVGFERLSSRIDVELPGVISVQRNSDESGRGDIAFVDFACNQVMEDLPSSALPQIAFPSVGPKGLLALTDEGDFYLVNAVERRLDLIAHDVSLVRTEAETLWTLEAGEIVRRDSNFAELERFGTGVVDFTLPGGTALTVAFMDESGLNVWSKLGGVVHLSDTACAPVSWGLDTLAYFDPCETSTLKVYTQGDRLGVDDEFVHILGPDGATLLERGLAYWGQGSRVSELLFLTSGSNGDRLMLGSVPKDAEVVEGTVELETTVLSDDAATIRNGILYTGWNGVAGTLVERQRDEEGETTGLIPVAPLVAQLPGSTLFSSMGVLSHFDGTVGRLEIVTTIVPEPNTVLLADGVPIQTPSIEVETGRRAFIGESDDGIVGNLYLTDEPESTVGFIPDLRKVGSYAHIDTARFLDQPRGLAYLARKPGETFATLKVWLIDSELTATIHNRVSEYRTVPWPAPGILYAVPSGDDAGLWFSKAR